MLSISDFINATDITTDTSSNVETVNLSGTDQVSVQNLTVHTEFDTNINLKIIRNDSVFDSSSNINLESEQQTIIVNSEDNSRLACIYLNLTGGMVTSYQGGTITVGLFINDDLVLNTTIYITDSENRK